MLPTKIIYKHTLHTLKDTKDTMKYYFNSLFAVAASGLIILSLVASTASASVPSGTVPFNTTVNSNIWPQIERLLTELAEEGRDYEIDGIPVFNGSDKFLTGKIALGMAHVISEIPDDDPRLSDYLADFRKIAKLTVNDPNDSWGIYYYLNAIEKLHSAGRLEEAVDRLSLAKLRVRLDWRTFVDRDTYELIDHPTNYYCVAFGIARLRAKLGWEKPSTAKKLYSRIVNHYNEFSGPYGFSDETDGDGRFDRYSILLAAEIAQHFLHTGDRPPKQIRIWLRQSAEIMMQRINTTGNGFEYGRSLGPYGATSIIEVLTAAAVSGLLDQRELDLAYAFVSRVAERYVGFWIDPKTKSVNLWDNGRRTDAYRGKFRILGENLSLAHQLIYTNAAWNKLGFKDQIPSENFEAMVAELPSQKITWFSKGEYDRLLVSMRFGDRFISLPIINGGPGQHDHNPYYPIPFSPAMLEGVADGDAPIMVPRFTLADDSVVMPLSYFRDAKVETQGETTIVSWHQTELNRIGARNPMADKRMSVRTQYEFSPGVIRRTDVYTPTAPIEAKSIEMQFGTFSSQPEVNGTVTTFASGTVRSFEVSGFSECGTEPVGDNNEYHTQIGAMQTIVNCRSAGANLLSDPFTLSWEIHYQ